MLTEGHQALIDRDPGVGRDTFAEHQFSLFRGLCVDVLPAVADAVYMDVDANRGNAVADG